MKTAALDAHPRPIRRQISCRPGKPASLKTTARINFTVSELFWQVLTAKRWELRKALRGARPVSIREAARGTERAVKAVHGDVTALRNAGLLDRTEDGRIVVPYDALKVEFLLQAA